MFLFFLFFFFSRLPVTPSTPSPLSAPSTRGGVWFLGGRKGPFLSVTPWCLLSGEQRPKAPVGLWSRIHIIACRAERVSPQPHPGYYGIARPLSPGRKFRGDVREAWIRKLEDIIKKKKKKKKQCCRSRTEIAADKLSLLSESDRAGGLITTCAWVPLPPQEENRTWQALHSSPDRFLTTLWRERAESRTGFSSLSSPATSRHCCIILCSFAFPVNGN